MAHKNDTTSPLRVHQRFDTSPRAREPPRYACSAQGRSSSNRTCATAADGQVANRCPRPCPGAGTLTSWGVADGRWQRPHRRQCSRCTCRERPLPSREPQNRPWTHGADRTEGEQRRQTWLRSRRFTVRRILASVMDDAERWAAIEDAPCDPRTGAGRWWR
ncbi:DUF6192 family protein [Streptomyces sp. NPDC007905]|uniref:DUF6192 family protein n=1 Tax=Streptomyces sp. NPDC007905 TaxID=3364788 RepID=UPI0036ECDCB4